MTAKQEAKVAWSPREASPLGQLTRAPPSLQARKEREELHARLRTKMLAQTALQQAQLMAAKS